MSRGTLDTSHQFMFSHTRLSRSMAGLSRTFLLTITDYVEVRTPECTHSGLGSSHFARRYFGNRCFFLFLSLLRCFSSGGSPSYVMDWRMSTWSLSMWVSPFRNLRIKGYLLLPEAYLLDTYIRMFLVLGCPDQVSFETYQFNISSVCSFQGTCYIES